MNGEFVEALNDCVERLAKGESIQACLNRYPMYADETQAAPGGVGFDHPGRGGTSAGPGGQAAQLSALLPGDFRVEAARAGARAVVAALEVRGGSRRSQGRRWWGSWPSSLC